MPTTGDHSDRPTAPEKPGEVGGERPAVPKVKQPEPTSAQFQKEVREEIAKEKLDP